MQNFTTIYESYAWAIIRVFFSPILRWGLGYECANMSLSDSVQLVTKIAASYLAGYESRLIESTAFLLNGLKPNRPQLSSEQGEATRLPTRKMQRSADRLVHKAAKQRSRLTANSPNIGPH